MPKRDGIKTRSGTGTRLPFANSFTPRCGSKGVSSGQGFKHMYDQHRCRLRYDVNIPCRDILPPPCIAYCNVESEFSSHLADHDTKALPYSYKTKSTMHIHRLSYQVLLVSPRRKPYRIYKLVSKKVYVCIQQQACLLPVLSLLKEQR